MGEREVWEKIAESFDRTRRKPWEKVVDFIEKIPNDSIVVDLGCGNGRHLLISAQKCRKAIGIDFSRNLLMIAKSKAEQKGLDNVDFLLGDCRSLPIKDDSVDYILFVATLHNIRGKRERLKALREVRRILKSDGKALITVWARWQGRFFTYFLRELFFRKGEFGDIEILWKKDNLNVPRFYHLYSKREFLKELKSAGLEVEKIEAVKIVSKILKDNFFAIVKKKKFC